MTDVLPHINASLNLVITILLISAFRAIRRGDRILHARLMKAAVAVGVLFVIGYVTATLLIGHLRFPGEGALRMVFLAILTTHTILAVAIVPLVFRSVQLALRDRLDEHRQWVRYTLPAWLYVCITGLVIHTMNTLAR